MNSRVLLVAIAALFCFTAPNLYADNKYVGAGKCKSCHKSKKQGQQYGIWQKSEHAKAFNSLATAEAKKLAQSVSVSGDPQKAKECLVCHTSPKYDSQGKARPASMFGKKFDVSEGVQCESCHGPGDKYWKKKVMKKIREEGGVRKSATAKKVGLRLPDEKVCQECHVAETKIGGVVYKNPSFKGFDFEKQVKQIMHPVPKK